MSFESYGWSLSWDLSNSMDSFFWKQPWKNKEKKKPHDLSSFNTDSWDLSSSMDSFFGNQSWKNKEIKKINNLSSFNTDSWNSFNINSWNLSSSMDSFFGRKSDIGWVDKKNENIKTENNYKDFDTEWLLSFRKKKKKEVNKVVKKYLRKKYKNSNTATKKKDILLKDVSYPQVEVVPKEQYFVKYSKKRIKNERIHLNKKHIVEKKLPKKEIDKITLSLNKDLLQKKAILQKDKEHNLHVHTLQQQGKTKKEILSILNIENRPLFIKYWKNHEAFWINSLPMEKIWKMTYCSRTARKNLYRLWVDEKLVPVGPSAIASMKMYWNKENYWQKLDKLPQNVNVLDLFIDSLSEYEHRAAAFLANNWWFVWDPYSKLKSNKDDTTLPIPMDEYLKEKTLLWAFAYVVWKSV